MNIYYVCNKFSVPQAPAHTRTSYREAPFRVCVYACVCVYDIAKKKPTQRKKNIDGVTYGTY